MALGRRSPEGLDHLPPRALFTDPRSSAGLALGTSHCVLGDSLAPNSPGNSGLSGFQGHFQFYSSGKIFAVCLMVCSEPWLLVETAFRWLPPLPGSHGPTDQEFPRVAGSHSLLCPSPQSVPVTQWPDTDLAGTLEEGQSRQGLRWRWTRKGRVEEQGTARGGTLGWGGQRMREIQDGLGPCLLVLHPSSLCDISRWERVAGAGPECPDWPPSGSLLAWPFLLTPMISAARELLTGPSRHQVCMALSLS